MAKLLLRRKRIYSDRSIKDQVVWNVSLSEKYPDGVRYRLAFIAKRGQKPAVLYDNHYPKGHHKHIHGKEIPYEYQSIEKLFDDFENDVKESLRENI